MMRHLKAASALGLLFGTNVALAGMPSTVITINFMDAPTSVPLLSSPMLLVLALLLFVVGYRSMKNPAVSRISSVMLMGLALLTSSFGGLKLIEEAHATGNLLEVSDNGMKTSFPVYNNGYFAVQNETGTPQVVTGISLTNQGNEPGQCDQNTGGGTDANSEIPDCTVGFVLNTTAGNRELRSCEVRVVCTPDGGGG